MINDDGMTEEEKEIEFQKAVKEQKERKLKKKFDNECHKRLKFWNDRIAKKEREIEMFEFQLDKVSDFMRYTNVEESQLRKRFPDVYKFRFKVQDGIETRKKDIEKLNKDRARKVEEIRSEIYGTEFRG